MPCNASEIASPRILRTRQMRIQMTVSAFCLLAGCSASTSADLPPSLIAPAQPPVILPDRAMTMTEVEIYWGRDRSALRQCVSQVAGIAEGSK